MMSINVFKRSSTVASSVSKYYVQSLNLHHRIPVLFKATECRPVFVRNFQIGRDSSDESEGELSLDKVAERLSVDIANVCILHVILKVYHGLVITVVGRCSCTGLTWIITTLRFSPFSNSTSHLSPMQCSLQNFS